MRGAVVSLFLTLAIAASAPAAERVTFTFAPRAGSEFLQRMTTHTLVRIPADGSRRETVQESVTHLRWQRDGKGWRLIGTPRSVRLVRDGVETSDPTSGAMIGRSIVYRLGPAAEVEAVEGMEALVAAMLDSMPAEVRATAAASLDPEAMKARETHDFEARITEWAGADVEEGAVLRYSDAVTLPSGALVMHVRTLVGPVRSESDRRLATLHTVSDTDSSAVDALFASATEGRFQRSDLDSLEFREPRVVIVIERVLDTATLDIVSETSDRLMHLNVQLPDGSQTGAVRTERRTWVFEDVTPRKR